MFLKALLHCRRGLAGGIMGCGQLFKATLLQREQFIHTVRKTLSCANKKPAF